MSFINHECGADFGNFYTLCFVVWCGDWEDFARQMSTLCQKIVFLMNKKGIISVFGADFWKT